MYKYLFRIVLGVMGLVEMLAIGVVSAEYSQVINITGTNGDIIQSFEQKWEDLEVYFLDDAGKVNHYTMMDRNMGATEIYNGDFSTGGINTGSFGYHYQWGNNYGFAPCIATGESCDSFPNGETTTNTRVPKSVWMLYVPSNYANNKWIRKDPRMESSVDSDGYSSYYNNDNLWGGSGDAGYNHLTGNIIDRRGPCPNGYYVPSISNLRTLLGSRNKYSSIKSGNQFASDLLLPPAGYRRYGGTMYNQGKFGIYLSSSPAATQYMGINSVTCGIKIEATKVSITYPEYGESMDTDRGIGRGNGNSVRCFKGTENNNYNIYGNGGTGAVIIIHRNKVLALSNPMNRTGIFVGWYDANEGGNEVKKGDTAPRNLYARWDCYEGYELSGGQCMPKRYKIEYELNGGELDELIEEYTIESDDISLKDPLKSGYIFIGRSGTDIDGYTKDVVILAGSTGNRSYEAKWACNLGYVENSDGSNCEKIRVEFDANGGKFNGEFDTTSVGTTIKTISHEETKRLHTINLTDEGDYRYQSTSQDPGGGCAYANGSSGSGNIEIHGYSTGYIQIEGAESLNVSIKYGGSSYGNTCAGPIGIWTGEHTNYDPRNLNHSGSAVWYLYEFPAYGTFGTDEFVVQGDSISIVQSSGCPNYGWYVTVTKEGVYEVVYESGAFDDIPQPTREGHSFKGRYLSDDTEFKTGSISTGEVTYVYAKWECADGYENKGGECIKKSSGSSGGGGGGGNSSSKIDTGSASLGTGNQINSNTGDIASTGTNIKEPETNTGSNTQTGSQVNSPEQTPQNDESNAQDSTTSSQNDGKRYSTEFQEAYEFAKGNGITTMPTIQKANMEGKLTRIAMAKMLSQYAINVLGQKPANIITPKFNDVTDKQNSDYDDGITLAYQLGIMGQNMPGNNFRPNDEVTRAEFATALSRMAYGTSDGEYKGTGKYYIHHMEKLVKEGIITKDDPNMKELRGYVMIMLMRSSK